MGRTGLVREKVEVKGGMLKRGKGADGLVGERDWGVHEAGVRTYPISSSGSPMSISSVGEKR